MRLKKKELEKIIKEANALLSEDYSTGVEDTDEDLSAWGGKCYINAGPDRDLNEKIALPFRALGIPKVICDLISIKVYGKDPADTPSTDPGTETGVFTGDYFDNMNAENIKFVLTNHLSLDESNAVAKATEIDDVLTEIRNIKSKASSPKDAGLSAAQKIFPSTIGGASSSSVKNDTNIKKRIKANTANSTLINSQVEAEYIKAIKHLVSSTQSSQPAGPAEDDPPGRKKLKTELFAKTAWS